MDFSSSDDLENEKWKSPASFEPNRGDSLLKLKVSTYSKDVFVWRMIITAKDVKKIWPIEDDTYDCPHEDLYWAIDFDKRLITLCNQCQNFAFGQKTEES